MFIHLTFKMNFEEDYDSLKLQRTHSFIHSLNKYLLSPSIQQEIVDTVIDTIHNTHRYPQYPCLHRVNGLSDRGQ